MSKITGYILRQITMTTVTSTVILCLAVMLIQSVRLVDLIINNGLSLIDFGYLSLLAMPRYLTLVLPLTLFGSLVVTYNRMINDSELVVLRSAGLSHAYLARAGLLIALFCTLFSFYLSLYVTPVSIRELRGIILETRAQLGSVLLKEGKFNTIGDKITVFVKRRHSGGDLEGIMIHDSTNPNNEMTILAKRGTLIDTPDGPRIIVLDGVQQSFRDGKLHVLAFDRSSLDIGGPTQKNGKRWIEPQERFLNELFNPNMDDPNDVHYQGKLLAEAHKRLTTPILPLLCSIIGLIFILKGGYSRHGNMKQILLGIVVMAAFYVGILWLSIAVAKNLKLVIPLYATAIIPTIFGLIYLHIPARLKKTPTLSIEDKTPSQNMAGG